MKIAIRGIYKGYPIRVERECELESLSRFVEQAIQAGIEKPNAEPTGSETEKATPSNDQEGK